jgi:hypothetical protein
MNQLCLPLETPAPPTSGEKRVQGVVTYVAQHPIHDKIADGSQLQFLVPDHLMALDPIGNQVYRLHRNAFLQLCNKLHFPQAYAMKLLRTPRLQDLAKTNIDTLLTKDVPSTNFLLRSVHIAGQATIYGFLSTAYKRLDTASLISAFIHASKRVGALPLNGYFSDLQVAVITALPKKWKVADRDVQVGVILEQSDFGVRALEVQFCLWDHGLMIGHRGLRRVHLGKKIEHVSDNIELATSTATTEVMEMVATHLQQDRIETTMVEMQMLGEKQLKPDDVAAILKSLPLLEEEVAETVRTFQSYPIHSVYHLAAALAWVGHNANETDRKLALAETAGGILMPSTKR